MCVYVSGTVCVYLPMLVFFFFALFLAQQQELKAEPGEGVEGDEGKEAETPTQVCHSAKVVQRGLKWTGPLQFRKTGQTGLGNLVTRSALK